MQNTNHQASETALNSFRDVVRRWAAAMHGYECQEADGEYMLAFHCGMHAINFCLSVRMTFCLVCPVMKHHHAHDSCSSHCTTHGMMHQHCEVELLVLLCDIICHACDNLARVLA